MKFKRIYNRYFPLKGYTTFTFFRWLFIREDQRQKLTPTVSRHETTHFLQQMEVTMFGIMLTALLCAAGFEWWSLVPLGLYFEIYLLEWLIKIPFCKFDTDRAYRSISFEQEAYYNQGKVIYNLYRVDYAWIRYIFKLYKKK